MSIYCYGCGLSTCIKRLSDLIGYDHHDDDNDDNGCVVAGVVDTWGIVALNSVHYLVDDSGRHRHHHCSRRCSQRKFITLPGTRLMVVLK